MFCWGFQALPCPLTTPEVSQEGQPVGRGPSKSMYWPRKS